MRDWHRGTIATLAAGALVVLAAGALVLLSVRQDDNNDLEAVQFGAILTGTHGLCRTCHAVGENEGTGKLPRKASRSYGLCVTCHNGSGSQLDVLDGVRLGTAVDNPILNGGGFMFVGGLAVTSRHNANPTDNSRNPWGLGANANTGQNQHALPAPLRCTSCHDPHGSSNYRDLQDTVNGEAVNVKAFWNGAFTKQEGDVVGLAAGAPADKYVREYYSSSGDSANGGKGNPGIGSLCGACHTAYVSDGASVPLVAGGAKHYRHRTEMPFTDWANPDTGRTSQNPETSPVLGTQPGQNGDFPALRLASNATMSNLVVQCLTCHLAHGSSVSMTGYALKPSVGAVTGGIGRADEDLTPSQTTSDHTGNPSSSALLFTNNRGMCQACHQWGVVE